MIALVAPALRVVWCLTAGATLLVALRVWWPIHLAAVVAARGPDRPLRVWAGGLSNALGGMVLVGALNLAAGLYSAVLPVRPDVQTPPRDLVDFAPLVVPALFIASAAIKLSIVVGVWRAYRDVVRRPPPAPRDGALD